MVSSYKGSRIADMTWSDPLTLGSYMFKNIILKYKFQTSAETTQSNGAVAQQLTLLCNRCSFVAECGTLI